MTEDITLRLLAGALPQLEASFRNLPPQGEPAYSFEAMAAVLSQVAERMGDNYPYFHPLYAGQMLKPPHPIARAAYALAMTIKPQQPRPGWWARQFWYGSRSGARDRRHVRLDRFSWPPHQRRNLC